MNDKAVLEQGLEAFAAALDDFRTRPVSNNGADHRRLQRHLQKLSDSWDVRFGPSPRTRLPYASMWGVARRGVRDKYLKKIIVSLLGPEQQGGDDAVLVNPVCVFGRHARSLASRLLHFKVIGTDISPTFNRLYGLIPMVRSPENYRFERDDIFSPTLNVSPAVVVFFGACGSLSDAAMDYAIRSNAPYLACRTCCHDNIAGNMRIEKRLTPLNLSFRAKNFVHSRRQSKRPSDHYFSNKYSPDHYPTSTAAKRLSSSDEFLRAARNSTHSDLCRTIIDLDRYLHLAENQYKVWYKAEMFVAEKPASPAV